MAELVSGMLLVRSCGVRPGRAHECLASEVVHVSGSESSREHNIFFALGH